ncbi:MAG: DUF2062 domain-containing protein [Lentisphaeria bacterium]|nr:DUF2062 domain-containing protein [Lentisphaeria bacterium]
MNLKPLFTPAAGKKARVALFLSGSGSNARKLLSVSTSGSECSYEIVVLVTDAPETSTARVLAKEYALPLIELDIKKFYAEHGEEKIALSTPRRCELRDEWSDKLYKLVEPYQIDFGVLAGFVPLSNIVSKIPCLNVHPGDLTVTEDGVRIFAGLHYLPVENAILRGNDTLRSSVILAQNYSGSGKKEVDSGPILGISSAVPVEFNGNTVEQLKEIKKQRENAPYQDALRQVASDTIEQLKIHGDHVVYPEVVEHFAHGDYALDEQGALHFLHHGKWEIVETVEFSGQDKYKLRRPADCNLIPGKSKHKGSYFRRLFKYYYNKIVRTPGTPEFVARGWALGVAVGCIVPVFCQLIVAIPLSFLFRCSKVGAIGGTFITTPPTAIFIYPVQIWVGNKIINGDLSSDAALRLVEIFNSDTISFTQKWSAFADMGMDLVAAFFAGGVVWALVMVPLIYFSVKKSVISYRNMRDNRRKKKLKVQG